MLLQTAQAPVRQLVCLCVVVLRGATPVFFAMLFASWARAVARRGAPPATTLGPLLLGSGLAGGAKWRVAPGRAIAHGFRRALRAELCLRSEHPVASPRIVRSRFGPKGKGQMPIKMRRSLLTFIYSIYKMRLYTSYAYYYY